MKFPFLRTYFSFSKREKNGLLVLLSILFVIVGINLLLPVIISTPKYDFTEWEQQVAAYQEKRDSVLREKNRLHPVPFDPNKVSRKELLAMGIAEKPASAWANYLRKGGHFRKPEDIGKIYGLPDSVSKKLIPFVRIEEDATPRTSKSEENKPDRVVVAGEKPRVRAAVPVKRRIIPVVDLRAKLGLVKKDYNKNTRIIVVEIADKCLYAAKKSQRNAWVGALGNSEDGISLPFNDVVGDIEKARADKNVVIKISLPKDKHMTWE